MGVTRAKNRMNAEEAMYGVQILLKNPVFRELHSRLSGRELYSNFIAFAGRRQDNPQGVIQELLYSFEIRIARILFAYEANQTPLKHPTDAEPVTRKTEDGSLEVLVGGGAAAEGYTIHINPTAENSVTYGNGH